MSISEDTVNETDAREKKTEVNTVNEKHAVLYKSIIIMLQINEFKSGVPNKKTQKGISIACRRVKRYAATHEIILAAVILSDEKGSL
ncbi:hypothetical protein [Treponema sp.]|uniref:hypothetical protein n=1 Tax=Treponema sp. TaxID=166 RepID=UPI00257951C2|nr:hypothetical protein [Treponema sp.]